MCMSNDNRWGTRAVSFLLVVIVYLPFDAAAESDVSEGGESKDGELTVRTVERETLQRDDERFASGHSTRVGVDDLYFRGQTLGDALGRVTGTYVRSESSFGQPAFLSVRGGNSRQTVVELDGLRLSSSAGHGFDAGQMMTGGLESADIIRGSGAAVYGGGAVTGAVRLNPAMPPEDGWEITGQSSVGSFGSTAVNADAGVGDEVMGLRLHGGVRQSRGDFDFVDDQGTEHRRINNDHQRVGFGTTGRLERGDDHFRLTGRWESGDAGSPGPSEFQQSFQSARVDDDRQLATLRWDRREALQSSSIIVDTHATAGVQQRSYRYRNEEGFMTREPFESHSTQRVLSTTGGAAALIGNSHLARVDVEGRRESYEAQIETSNEAGISATRHTAMGSVSDEWLLFDDHLSLIAAVRAELSEDSNRSSATIEPFLPALGAITRVHRRLEFRANMARTFRNADFDELYLETEGVRGDPTLEPEQAWTADAGIQLGAGDDPLSVRGAYFTHFIDSTILFLPVSAHLFEAQNLHDATSRGVEAAMRAQIGDRWALSGGYTLTRATLGASSGASPTQLPGQPRHRIAVDSAFDIAGLAIFANLPETSISTALHYRSRVNLDNFGNLQNPGVLRLDMGATSRISDWLRAGLHIQDILDQNGAYDRLHRPLPGRAMLVSIEVQSDGGGR